MTKRREDSVTKDGLRNQQINANSIYYIYTSEYSKQIHVSDPLNEKKNYGDQRDEMHNFFVGKNKIGFNDGKLEMPEEGMPNPKICTYRMIKIPQKVCNFYCLEKLHSEINFS